MKTKTLTGAQALIESLIKEGVDVIFGYPGGAIMPVYDALYDFKDKVRHILVRHEQGAAHAAEGYARVAGKPGVCFATSGPGATNLVTGITDAMMDSVPIVCITGQVTMSVIGTDAFQEADVIGITTPITKWAYQVTKAEEIPQIIKKAFYISRSGRPGPVLIDITKNAQFETFEYQEPDRKPPEIRGFKVPEGVDMKKIQEAAKLLNEAKQPYILIGHGILISKAQEALKKFIEKGGFPVGSTLHGLSALPSDHPLYIGMLGMHGNYGANRLTNWADVILAVGMRFDDRVTGRVDGYAPGAKIIHIDIDPAELDKIIKTEVAINADAKTALEELTPLIKKADHSEWIGHFKEANKTEYEKVSKHELFPETGEIRMAEVIRKISEMTKNKAVIVADVGQHQMSAARYSKFSETDSYITSGGLGTMGFALPAVMGVKVGVPNRIAVAVIGDGSFQMNIQELGTIAQEKLPVKIVILNNNFLGMVRQWQQLFFDNRYSFVELKNPDFVAVSKGFGINAEIVKDRKDLDKALKRMFDFDGPYLLDIRVLKEDNVFPMVPSGASVDEIRLE
ncbi:MAG TPA: biosynthetic-type acetolactate synthase large subunit [Patescibacteria group bacterium]|nr:biosynthetic-type acetolactate synthase large subunit [Patescibacteria group bacterium]